MVKTPWPLFFQAGILLFQVIYTTEQCEKYQLIVGLLSKPLNNQVIVTLSETGKQRST